MWKNCSTMYINRPECVNIPFSMLYNIEPVLFRVRKKDVAPLMPHPLMKIYLKRSSTTFQSMMSHNALM